VGAWSANRNGSWSFHNTHLRPVQNDRESSSLDKSIKMACLEADGHELFAILCGTIMRQFTQSHSLVYCALDRCYSDIMARRLTISQWITTGLNTLGAYQ
jgi:hypothetical protein